MAVIELVEELKSVVAEAERARGTKVAAKKAPTGRTKEIAEDASAESATAAAVVADAEASEAVDETSAENAEIGEGLAAIGLATEDAEAAAEATPEAIGGEEPEAGAQETADPEASKPSED